MSAVVTEMLDAPVFDEYVTGEALGRAITLPESLKNAAKLHLYVSPVKEVEVAEPFKSNQEAQEWINEMTARWFQ